MNVKGNECVLVICADSALLCKVLFNCPLAQ